MDVRPSPKSHEKVYGDCPPDTCALNRMLSGASPRVALDEAARAIAG